MFVLSGKVWRKVVGILSGFFLVALAAICMTLYLSWQLEGVAAAINDAGSQRMRTYRMAYLIAQRLKPAADTAPLARKLERETALFDSVLRDLRLGDPQRPMASPRNGEVGGRLADVERAWRETTAPGRGPSWPRHPARRQQNSSPSRRNSKASSPGSTTSSSPWNRAMRAIPSCYAARRRR